MYATYVHQLFILLVILWAFISALVGCANAALLEACHGVGLEKHVPEQCVMYVRVCNRQRFFDFSIFPRENGYLTNVACK